MHLDRDSLDKKCQEMIDDIDRRKATSSAWLWAGAGAVIGVILSSLRIGRKSEFTNSKWNSKVNTGC